MKKEYQIFPVSKPELNQLIWYIGPIAKEILGFYLGATKFVEADGTYRGYFAKYWRAADDVEKTLASWSPFAEEVPEKRKYTPRKPKD